MSQNGVDGEQSKSIDLDSSLSKQNDASDNWLNAPILQPSPIMLSLNVASSPKLPPISLPTQGSSSLSYGWRGWISDTLTKNQRFHNMVYYRIGNLKYLADTLAEPEPWGKELKILKIYMDNTFKRIVEENKFVAYFPEDQDVPILIIFNTGLLSRTNEDIFCILQSIHVASVKDREQESGGRRCEERQWILKEFLPSSSFQQNETFDKYGPNILPLIDLPKRAYYFVDGVQYACFDPEVPIEKDNVDFSEIIKNSSQSKIDRLPQEYVNWNEKELQTRFKQGITPTIIRARSNPRCAVPQFHRDSDGLKRIDLLLPLSMSGKKEPDCALVIRYNVTEEGVRSYLVRGILSKEDSYINARVIQRIDQKWMEYMELGGDPSGMTPILMSSSNPPPSPHVNMNKGSAPPTPHLLSEKQLKKEILKISTNLPNNSVLQSPRFMQGPKSPSPYMHSGGILIPTTPTSSGSSSSSTHNHSNASSPLQLGSPAVNAVQQASLAMDPHFHIYNSPVVHPISNKIGNSSSSSFTQKSYFPPNSPTYSASPNHTPNLSPSPPPPMQLQSNPSPQLSPSTFTTPSSPLTFPTSYQNRTYKPTTPRQNNNNANPNNNMYSQHQHTQQTLMDGGNNNPVSILDPSNPMIHQQQQQQHDPNLANSHQYNQQIYNQLFDRSQVVDHRRIYVYNPNNKQQPTPPLHPFHQHQQQPQQQQYYTNSLGQPFLSNTDKQPGIPPNSPHQNLRLNSTMNTPRSPDPNKNWNSPRKQHTKE